MKYNFTYQVNRLPYCCGVYEVGAFHLGRMDEEKIARLPREYSTYKFDTPEAAYKAALDVLLSTYPHFSLQFWFYKQCDYNDDFAGTEYIEDGFRQVVKAHPDCVELAEYVNRNSGNMINGFLIQNDTSKIKNEVYESEDRDDEY